MAKAKKSKKKWMQGAVKKEGSFTSWCKSQGFGGVTSACISKGKASKNITTRRRAMLAEKFRKFGGRKKKKG